MQEHLLTRDSAIAYLLDNGGIKNIAGTACENVHATRGRSGYRPDNACPGKLVQKTSMDFSELFHSVQVLFSKHYNHNFSLLLLLVVVVVGVVVVVYVFVVVFTFIFGFR